jgi:uncharacterized tellurite resistance protein B-like protein
MMENERRIKELVTALQKIANHKLELSEDKAAWQNADLIRIARDVLRSEDD